ncbi:MAG: glycosyltransferase family 39 protein [bacterium]|nr:glycosyltransferase family 39 protein [bacterium]
MVYFLKTQVWLKEKYLLLGLFFFDFGLRLFRLWEPAQAYFDEQAYYLPAARGYLEGNPSLNLEHPPLAKLLLAFSIKLFGDNFFGWRFFGVLLASLSVVVLYLLTKEITRSRKVAFLASSLLIFDFGWFALSRVGTIDIYLASFSFLGAYFVFRLWREGRVHHLAFAGLSLGAAFASKWSSVLIIFWLILFLLVFWKKSLQIKMLSLFAILGLIGAVYLASYLPLIVKHGWEGFVETHFWMVQYHNNFVPSKTAEALSGLKGKFYPFPAWSWLLDPVFPFFGEVRDGTVRTILFFFNPLVLWGGFASLTYLIWEQRHKIDPEKIFVIGAVFFLWAPWLASPRYSLHYYLLPALPFLCFCFALGIKKVWQRSTSLAYSLVAVSLLLFVVYYPLISALKVPYFYSRIVSGIVEFKNVPGK